MPVFDSKILSNNRLFARIIIRTYGNGWQKTLQRKARRRGFSMVIGYGLLKGEFDTLVGNGGVAAPERPNKQ